MRYPWFESIILEPAVEIYDERLVGCRFRRLSARRRFQLPVLGLYKHTGKNHKPTI